MRNIFVSIITALSTVFIALSACASETAVNTLASIAVFPVLYMSESAQKIISSNGLNAGKIVLSLEEALKDSHRFALFERSTEN